MQKIIKAVLGGIIAYVIISAAMTALITGTTTAENLMTTIVPLAIAFGVIMVSLGFGSNEANV